MPRHEQVLYTVTESVEASGQSQREISRIGRNGNSKVVYERASIHIQVLLRDK